MARGPVISLISLVLLAASILLVLLTVLGGAVDKNPTNRIYFLEANTQGIEGAGPLTRWTFWNVCSKLNERTHCPRLYPAYPFDPKRNFGGSGAGIPEKLIQHSERYFLMTRFMFVFTLLGLFSAVVGLFSGLLALCSRIGHVVSVTMSSIAFLLQTTAAALMSAAYIQGQTEFRADGRHASIGRKSFVFMWGAMTCLLLSTVLRLTSPPPVHEEDYLEEPEEPRVSGALQ